MRSRHATAAVPISEKTIQSRAESASTWNARASGGANATIGKLAAVIAMTSHAEGGRTRRGTSASHV